MSVIIAPRIFDLRNEFSDNLLNYESTFNNDLVWNITSGTGNISSDTSRYFQGGKAIKVINYDNIPMDFNTATDLGATIETDGSYILSFRLYKEVTNGDDPSFIVNIFRNGLLYHQISALYTDFSDIVSANDNWMCFAQSLDFSQNDVITYNFSFNPAFVNDEIWVDGFKLEYDDRNLGIPTAWSLPKNFCCSETKGYVKRSDIGWASYVDTLHTSGSPQLISEGVTPVLLTNNAGTTITSQLPDGVVKLFDSATTKIIPVQENDFNSVDIMFTVKNSVTNGFFTVYIDIPTLGTRFEQLFVCPKTAGTAMGINYSFHHYVSAQFAANGGTIYIVANSGNLQIYDKQYRFSKLINAK